MSECYGNYYILNGDLTPCGLFDNSDVYEGDSVYEVIRMMSGAPLFFDDHMERMRHSAEHAGHTMPASYEKMASDLILLRKNAGVKEANLKIVFNYKDSGVTYLLYFIEPLYPTTNQYRQGVNTLLYHAERENPDIKIVNHKLRSSIYNRLITTGAYEALLVNSEGFITEGSRSNIFFVKDNRLFTAPDDKVLGGITRKHIIDICNISNIDVVFSCIHSDSISEYDSVFMTGTSPMVLPVRTIDNTEFAVSNTLVDTLHGLYLERVKESLASFRRPK